MTIGKIVEVEIVSLLESRGWFVLGSSVRILGVECDIIATCEANSLWVLEVKYRRHASSWGSELLKKKQFERQMRVLRYLKRKYPGQNVQWALIWRKKSGGVEFVANPCYF